MLPDTPTDDESSGGNPSIFELVAFGTGVGAFVGGVVVGTRIVGRTLLDLILRRDLQNPVRPFLFGLVGGAVGGFTTVATFEIAEANSEIAFFQNSTNVVYGIPISAVVAILSSEYLA